MKQLIGTTSKVYVANTPAPNLSEHSVLVKVHYSLVSTGTELAPMKHARMAQDSLSSSAHLASYAGLLKTYSLKAIKNPKLALAKGGRVLSKGARYLRPTKTIEPVKFTGELGWRALKAKSFLNGKVITGGQEGDYQISTDAISTEGRSVLKLEFQLSVSQGEISIGVLNSQSNTWLKTRSFSDGNYSDTLSVDVSKETNFSVVFSKDRGEPIFDFQISTVELHDEAQSLEGDFEHLGWGLGYSCSGEVIEVGRLVSEFQIGDRVSCCGAGIANHAQFVAVPTNLCVKIPEKVDLKSASSATVGSIALQGIRRSSLEMGEHVLVLGLGLIGQISAQLVKQSGCISYGLDLNKKRVEKAELNGLHYGFTDDEDLLKNIQIMTRGHGVDKTIITASAKSDSIINLAMKATRRKGRVIVVGDVGLGVERAQFYKKEIDLLMSTSYGPGRYDELYEKQGIDYPYPYVRWTMKRNLESYLDQIALGNIDFLSLVELTSELSKAPDLYKALLESSEAPLAAIIDYTQATPSADTKIAFRGAKKPHEGLVRVGLWGVGAFGTSMLVPQIKKYPKDFLLTSVISSDAVRGGNYARSEKVSFLASSLQQLDRSELDLVIIATRHNQHAAQVIEAIEKGLHVFVEKPLATTWQDLHSVIKAYESKGSESYLMVGHNRRFSPAIQMLKKILKITNGPISMNYLVNAGTIPFQHWIQTAEGGGRNIGEACHMYDTMKYLCGSSAQFAQALSLGADGTESKPNDAFSAQIRYKNGSLGVLNYFSNGHKDALPKERLEVFVGNEVYIIDNYKTLIRGSTKDVLWQSEIPEKGHEQEFARLADYLKNPKDENKPIQFDDIVEVYSTALLIEDQIYGRNHS